MGVMSVVLMIVSMFCFASLVIAESAGDKMLPTAEDFFLHSGNMQSVYAFFSIFATSMGTILFLIVPNSLSPQNNFYIAAMLIPIIFALMIAYFGPRISYYGKSYGYSGILDFFDDIYGSDALNAIFFSVAMVSCFMFLLLQLMAGGLLVHIASYGRLPFWVGIIIFASFTGVSLLGHGIRNILMMDVYYSIVVIITFFASVSIGLIALKKYTIWSPSTALFVEKILDVNFMDVISMCVILPLGMVMMPHMWLRFYSVSKPATFCRKSWIVRTIAVCSVLVLIMMVILSILSSFSVEVKKENFYMLPILILEHLDPISASMLICGIAAAILPISNSQLHAMTQMYIYTMNGDKLGIKFDNKWLKSASGEFIILVLLVAILINLIIQPDLLGFMSLILGIVSQFAVATLGGLRWQRANSKGAIAGMCAGIVILLILTCGFDVKPLVSALAALLGNAMIFCIISKVLKPDKRTRKRIATYRGEMRKSAFDAKKLTNSKNKN